MPRQMWGSWVFWLLGLVFGACLGAAAWGEGRAPVLALALPLAVALSSSRLQAFWLAAGYAIGMLRYNASFVATWFDGNQAVGVGVVVVYAIVTGLVWCIAWTGSLLPRRRAGAMILAWTLAALPPFTIAVPGHPLVATGYLLPGFGWFGVVLSIVIPASLVWALAKTELSRSIRVGAGAGTLAMLAALGYLLHDAPASSIVRGVQPMTTAWGAHKGPDDSLVRIERMARAPVSPLAVVAVWPESILGRYEPSTYPVLDLELLRPSRRSGLANVIGMDIPLQGDRLLNSAVAFYADGSSATATARQPAPLALWRPWRDQGTFLANWAAHNMLSLGQGDRAAVIFCYEEYLPVLYLLNEAFDQPTVYLALANTWAAKNPASSAIQTGHSFGMAKLFGREYLKAENRPAAGAADWSPSVAP